jgi:hypothetical protein
LGRDDFGGSFGQQQTTISMDCQKTGLQNIIFQSVLIGKTVIHKQRKPYFTITVKVKVYGV